MSNDYKVKISCEATPEFTPDSDEVRLARMKYLSRLEMAFLGLIGFGILTLAITITIHKLIGG